MKQVVSLLLTLAVAIGQPTEILAQKKKEKKPDPKHANHFKSPEEIESKQVVLEMRDAYARMDLLKFRVKFTNKTNDFIRVNTGEFTISVNGRKDQPKGKQFFIGPNDSKGKTIELKGETDLHAEEFSFSPAGFALISVDDGKVVKADDFQLPASTNTQEAGNFSINLKKLKQETKETWARFEITYKGEGYGIVDPSRISVTVEGGQKFANDNRKSKNIVLEKGDDKTISAIFHIPAKVVDMQFATLQVNWNDALVETKAVGFEVDGTVTFELDEALTKEKN